MNRSVEAPNLTMSIVSDNDAFAAMADEWRALSAQCSTCFFMSWDWHYTWWQVYSSPNQRLYVVRFTAGDKLVGLLPMYLKRSGLTFQRSLQFLGTGEAREDEVATEYLDVIAHPNFSAVVANAAIEWLSSCAEWGSVRLISISFSLRVSYWLWCTVFMTHLPVTTIKVDFPNVRRIGICRSHLPIWQKLNAIVN